MSGPSQITVFTTVPGGDFVLNAESLAAMMGDPSGSGIIQTAITTVGNGTLTAPALVGGQIARTGPTGAFSDTTAAASAIVSALGTEFLAGQTFIFRIKNATAFVDTLAAGSGVTLPSTTLVPPFSVASYFGTVGGTSAAPTVTFTHIETVPIHAPAVQTNPQTSALNTVGAGTILAAGINAGYTIRGGTQTGAFTDTTDSLANIVAGVSALTNAFGTSVEWTYVNNTTYPATLAGATNVVFTGQTVIPANSWAKYLITNVSGTSITVVCIAAGYFPSSGTFAANGVTPVTVTNAAVTAGSNIVITLKTVGGTVGAIPHVETITPGTGFTVIGTATDTSTYNYEIRG